MTTAAPPDFVSPPGRRHRSPRLGYHHHRDPDRHQLSGYVRPDGRPAPRASRHSRTAERRAEGRVLLLAVVAQDRRRRRVRRVASTIDRGIVSLVWNFGDGFERVGQRETHDYALPGTYQATLTVTDARGGRDTSGRRPLRSPPTRPRPRRSRSRLCPRAIPPAVSFEQTPAESTAALGREIVGYEWDFGDGAPHVGGIAPFQQLRAARHLHGHPRRD